MNCPNCKNFNTSRVIYTVPIATATWRVRKCDICNHKWSTSEMEDEPLIGTVEQMRDRINREKRKQGS